jgi:hypothetical protein
MEDVLEGVAGGVSWGGGVNREVYYATMDDAHRPDKVWRHRWVRPSRATSASSTNRMASSTSVSPEPRAVANDARIRARPLGWIDYGKRATRNG